MDVNTLYAATELGSQDAFDTEIIKEVWSSNTDMSNFTSKDFEGEDNICEKAYEKLGAEGYNRCYNAAISANTPEHNALVIKYAEAQAKGYSKDFESFKKKSSTLSSIGELAGGLLGGLFGNISNREQVTQDGGGYYPPQEKSKTGLYIGLGAVALIGIGVAIYFGTRKK